MYRIPALNDALEDIKKFILGEANKHKRNGTYCPWLYGGFDGTPPAELTLAATTGGGSNGFAISLLDRDLRTQVSVFSAQISAFTNNCGMKAINGLHSYMPTYNKLFMFLLETYLVKGQNASMVVGSDRVAVNPGTVWQVIDGMPGWVVAGTVHNYNYALPKEGGQVHDISLFFKDLTQERAKYVEEFARWIQS